MTKLFVGILRSVHTLHPPRPFYTLWHYVKWHIDIWQFLWYLAGLVHLYYHYRIRYIYLLTYPRFCARNCSSTFVLVTFQEVAQLSINTYWQNQEAVRGVSQSISVESLTNTCTICGLCYIKSINTYYKKNLWFDNFLILCLLVQIYYKIY